METRTQIQYEGIEPKEEYEQIIQKVLQKCYEEEKLKETNLYVSITLTNPETIRTMNQQFRKIDEETDVLSFPMFEKEEIDQLKKSLEHPVQDVLGDMIISIPRVEEQAKEYGHSFERELAYMVVHSFYHLMGYDHICEEDKQKMRPKEEKILQELKITRDR